MATKMYLLNQTTDGARTNGVTGALVVAQSRTEAVALANSLSEGDSLYVDSDARGFEVATTLAAADLLGWKFKVRVYDIADPDADPKIPGGAILSQVEYTGVASDDIDDVGTALAIALALNSATANAAYDTGTNVLIIAEGSSDALGDHFAVVEAFAPNAAVRMATCPFLGTLTHLGVSSADVKITLVAASPIPTLSKTIGPFGVL